MIKILSLSVSVFAQEGLKQAHYFEINEHSNISNIEIQHKDEFLYRILIGYTNGSQRTILTPKNTTHLEYRSIPE